MGVSISTGYNALKDTIKINGNSSLILGTQTINMPFDVTANSEFILQRTNLDLNAGFLYYSVNIVLNTLTVTSSNGLDNGNFYWLYVGES